MLPESTGLLAGVDCRGGKSSQKLRRFVDFHSTVELGVSQVSNARPGHLNFIAKSRFAWTWVIRQRGRTSIVFRKLENVISVRERKYFGSYVSNITYV